MSAELREKVREQLCPEGNWKLTETVDTLLKLQTRRFPRAKVSEEEARYPTTPAGIRAFLEAFFARHYFQIQDSLLDYMTSAEFLTLLASKELRLLDIGCGPAVASLAISDMLGCIIKNLPSASRNSNAKMIKINYVLNDTSGICLGVGKELLKDYFRLDRQHIRSIVNTGTLTAERPFPSNMNQLRRIRQNFGSYDIVILSYVLNPLNEELGLQSVVDGLLQVEALCGSSGRVLILQDKFSASLIRKFARAIGESCQKGVLSQHVYSVDNGNELYTYSYYRCLFAPDRKGIEQKRALV